jgi:hypothetical protein
MTDKDFGRKPKFGPVSKKGSLKPPPKNCIRMGYMPGDCRGGSRTAPTKALVPYRLAPPRLPDYSAPLKLAASGWQWFFNFRVDVSIFWFIRLKRT